MDNLKNFASLRTKYILAILKESVEALHIEGVTDDSEVRNCLAKVSAVGYDTTTFDLLVVFDSIQFAQTWVNEWSKLLTGVKSLEEVQNRVQAMKHVVTVNDDGDGGSNGRAEGEGGRKPTITSLRDVHAADTGAAEVTTGGTSVDPKTSEAAFNSPSFALRFSCTSLMGDGEM